MEVLVNDDAVDVLPENAIPLILDALGDDSVAHDEFLDGLSKAVFRLQHEPGVAREAELLRFVRNWLTSVALPKSAGWLEQVEASEKLFASGTSERISHEELRGLLRR